MFGFLKKYAFGVLKKARKNYFSILTVEDIKYFNSILHESQIK